MRAGLSWERITFPRGGARVRIPSSARKRGYAAHWPPAKHAPAAEWPGGLGKGLQSPVHGFDSRLRLPLWLDQRKHPFRVPAGRLAVLATRSCVSSLGAQDITHGSPRRDLTMSQPAASPASAGRPRKSPLRLAAGGEPSFLPRGDGRLLHGQLRTMMISEFEQWLRSRTNQEKRPFQ